MHQAPVCVCVCVCVCVSVCAPQSIMLVCVCLPAIWLLRSSVTRWRIEATTDHEFFPELHGKKQQLGVETVAQTNMGGGRKMMTEVVPKPGAHLKHLILVSGKESRGYAWTIMCVCVCVCACVLRALRVVPRAEVNCKAVGGVPRAPAMCAA